MSVDDARRVSKGASVVRVRIGPGGDTAGGGMQTTLLQKVLGIVAILLLLGVIFLYHYLTDRKAGKSIKPSSGAPK